MNTTKVLNLDLNLTLFSGQCFNWIKINNWFYGSFIDKIVKLRLEKSNLIWQTYPKKDNFDFINSYFRLDFDYNLMQIEITKDLYARYAFEKYPGLRVLNQNFEQCLLSFVLATNKNIPSIRSSIKMLGEVQNKFINLDGYNFYFSPSAEFIFSTSEEILKTCSVGYRSRYLKSTANFLLSQTNFINQKDESIVREKLKTIFGVGDKVADCVMSFSIGFDNITPIDIWGGRLVRDVYKNKRAKSYAQKRKYLEKKFGIYTSWAGMFLFEWIRNNYKLIITNYQN